MTRHRPEFSAATKRQALEAAQHRCQDPLCAVSKEWAELVVTLNKADLMPSLRQGMSWVQLVALRDAILSARFKHAKVLRPIIKRFQLDASPLLEIDHERECADGGSNEIGNAIVRCVFCHAFKTQVRGHVRRNGPKKQARTFPEQLDVIKTAKVEGLRQLVKEKTGALGATRALSGAVQTDRPIARARMMAALPPALPQERRHYTDAQVTQAAQRRERAILDNDGFWGA